MDNDLVLLGLVFVGFLFLILAMYFVPVPLWVQARVAGIDISLFQLAFMRIRKTSPKIMVEALIMAAKGGVSVTTTQLETHYMTGGNVQKVVQSLIVAKKAAIDLNFEKAASIDLAGHDVLAEVRKKAAEKPINF